MKQATIIMAALLWPLASWGQIAADSSGWTDCTGTLLVPQPTSRTVVQGQPRTEVICFEWEDIAATVDSGAFFVEEQALLTCNLDVDGTNPPGSGGVVTPRSCPPISATSPASIVPTDLAADNCISLGALDGTEGDAATQTAAVRVQRGWYFFDLTTAVPDGDQAKCWAQAEKVR